MTNYYGLEPEYFRRHLSDCEWVDPASVPGADAASWRLLNHAWAVDANSVYLDGRRLKNVDRATFRVLNELYACDATRIFCTAGSTATIVDPASFEVLDDGGGRYSHDFQGYARDRTQVYFAETIRPPRVVKNADPATFTVYPDTYARDSNRLYYDGKPIAASSPDEVQPIDDRYVRAGSRVYRYGKAVKNARADQFRVLDSRNDVWRDDARIYQGGKIVEGADPETFQSVSASIARDAKQVFVNGKACPQIDLASFQHLGFDYFRDRKGPYWQGVPLESVHEKSFVATGYGTGRDRKRTIYQEGTFDSEIQKRRYGNRRGWPLLGFLWVVCLLVFSIIVAVFTWPYTWWKRRRARAMQAAETGHEAGRGVDRDVAKLARVLARGNEAALAPVMLAVTDMPAFRKKYLGRDQYADEPDFGYMMDRIDDDAEKLDALLVFETVFEYHGLLCANSWESSYEDTRMRIEPMLQRLGVRDFDWSFVDILVERGSGPELENENFLSVLRDELAPHGLKLVRVDSSGDNYGLSVVRTAEFPEIEDLGDADTFSISDAFGSDRGYKRARRLLEKYRQPVHPH